MLYGKIGENLPMELLEDVTGLNKIAVPVEPGNGVIPAGMILYRKSTGLWAPAEDDQITANYALCVLGQEVDTDANMTVAEDVYAFIHGNFIRGKVVLKNDDTITAALELVLRQQGIVIKPMADGKEFTNYRQVITYKANNSTTEADYTAYEMHGATHTVLANTVTGFTAPSTKSFSKWNTKADGSGTDYSAAGTYTANADLTLYAVWA